MKKLIALFLVATIMSCSSEDQGNQNIASSAKTSESVLDGKVLSFKDDESFIKEYSALTEVKTKSELQEWIAKKGHLSLLNDAEEAEVDQDSVFDTSKIICSDAIKAILSSDSKLKINGKLLWLQGGKFYRIADEDIDKNTQELIAKESSFEVYGRLDNEIESGKNETSKTVMPVKNGETRNFSHETDGKRFNLVVFIEVIGMGQSQISNLFLKSSIDYRSCSTWRCTWKRDTATGIYLAFENFSVEGCLWESYVVVGASSSIPAGGQTILLARKIVSGVPYVNCDSVGLNGTIKTTFLPGGSSIWTNWTTVL